jgi:hypothetical protein
MMDETKNYRMNLLKKQSILEKKIIFLQKQYDEIDKELDNIATKSNKHLPKYKKVKTTNEEGCNIA